MKKISVIVTILLSAALIISGNSAVVHGAKVTMITALPLAGIIDIDDRSYADNFYALQKDGTIWIGNGSKPAIRGPQIPGAIKISGNLVLTSSGEVWTWNKVSDAPKLISELSGIKSISAGGANMAINDNGQVYVWGSACLTSLIRPDFQDRIPLCYSSNSATKEDVEQASIPKIAIEGAKDIRASGQYMLILMADGKTIRVYGSVTNLDYGMMEQVSPDPIIDFAGNDKDAAGYWTISTLPDQNNTPVNHYRQVSEGYGGSYTLYLKEDGTVWGNTSWQDGPTQHIAPFKDIVKIAAVALNSGTALEYGKVWTWGDRTNIPFYEPKEKLLTKVNAKPSQKQISLRINGKFVASDPGPIQMNGTTFVPVRSLFESIGAKIGYNNDFVTVAYRKQLLAFKVYDTKATLDGKSIQMPAAPLSYQGRSYVPIRFLAQAFGAKVKWDNRIDGVDVQFPETN